MVYVLAKDGTPLMPTKNHGYVRVLLNSHRAVVVKYTPFTIRLKHSTTTYTQPLVCGIDPGRTNIGIAVVTEDGECVFSANADTHNKDIPKHMAERKLHRQASRHGERLRRQRRAKAAGTCFTEGERQRVLPGCKEPITCKSIKNSEARFNNRKREEGWLTPTANHLLDSHLSLLNKVKKILPIHKGKSRWTKEEDAILVRDFPSKGIVVKDLLPHRTKQSIYCRAAKLGLQSKYKKPWTAKELSILRELYPTLGQEVAKYLPNRERHSCTTKACQLGIKRVN